MEIKNLVDDFKMNRHLRQCRRYFRNIMWGMFIAGGVIYTLQNIQENTQRYLQMKTRTEVVAERNANKAFPIVTICLNSMHSRGINWHHFQEVYDIYFLELIFSSIIGKCGWGICKTYIDILC